MSKDYEKFSKIKQNQFNKIRADNIRPYGWRFVGADIIRPFLYNSLFLSCSSITKIRATISARFRRLLPFLSLRSNNALQFQKSRIIGKI